MEVRILAVEVVIDSELAILDLFVNELSFTHCIRPPKDKTRADRAPKSLMNSDKP